MLARWHKDWNGSLVASGTANAWDVAANRTISSYYDGLSLCFEVPLANTGAVTLDVDSVGAQEITQRFDESLVGGELQAGQKLCVSYDSGNTNWQMTSPSSLLDIYDDNGNALVVFTATPSAVNYLRIQNAGTSEDLVLEVTGSDTDVDLIVDAAGAGKLRLQASTNFHDNTVARANLADYSEEVEFLGTAGAAQTVDLEDGNVFTATVAGTAPTWTFSNPPASGDAGSFTLILTNGGLQTNTWPATVKWATPGTAPALTASGIDILNFLTTDGGSNWYGFPAGIGMQ